MLEVLDQNLLVGRANEIAFAAMIGRMAEDVDRAQQADPGRRAHRDG